MAKVKLNPLFNAIQGQLDGYIFRSMPDGTTVVSKAPDLSEVKWSKAQKAHRRRFKKAVAYARAALADPVVRLHYEEQALQLRKRPYHLAMSDFLKGINLLENMSSPGTDQPGRCEEQGIINLSRSNFK
jgi:hypothetical protein